MFKHQYRPIQYTRHRINQFLKTRMQSENNLGKGLNSEKRYDIIYKSEEIMNTKFQRLVPNNNI